MFLFESKDTFGDAYSVGQGRYVSTQGRVYLNGREGKRKVQLELTPKKARKLAKALCAAAKEAEACR